MIKKKDKYKDNDDNIDYSDIPETDEKFWENATVHLPRKKQSLTIRIDADVVEWFKKNGHGYQTHINAVLKTYMMKHQK